MPLRNPLFLRMVFIAAACSAIFAQTPDNISVDQLKADVYYLASPAMKGRDTPSPELDSAAVFIARRFQKCGLRPLHETGYMQPFNLVQTRLGKTNTLSLYRDGEPTDFKLKQHFSPLTLSGSGCVDQAPLIFAGYGITAPEYGYDDYAGINVQGAVVWILTLEPQAKDSNSVFQGLKKTRHAKIKTKLDNARAHGAAAVILMAGPLHSRFRRPPNPWPSLMRRPNFKALSYRPETERIHAIPAVQVGRAAAAKILAQSHIDIRAIQSEIDSTLTPRSFKFENILISMQLNFTQKTRHVHNVIGKIEGASDSLKSQAVIIGGHYDHLGMQGDTLAFAGADDNASGTATVMALARAFALADKRPARSLIFSAWAGEEKGLYGAGHFANHQPLWPTEAIAAYINIDMVGRLDSAVVHVAGTETCEGWETLVSETFHSEGLVYYNRKGVQRSDHVHFYRQHIPVLGLSTGYHGDYHKVTDTPDKCNYAGMCQIARALFHIILDISNTPDRPQFTEDPDSPLKKKGN